MAAFIPTLRGPEALRILLLALPLLIAAATVAGAADEIIAAIFAELSLPIPTTQWVVVCHGFGCQYRTQIALTSGDRAKLAALLAPGRASPPAERRAVAAASAWFDRRVGPAAGTTRRLARARGNGEPGQMDCIDISSNNTSLFFILQQLHLLQHHRIERPVSRGVVIDGRLPHTTAVLGEVRGGRKWAVDNWTHKYGERPEVEPLEQWLNEGF